MFGPSSVTSTCTRTSTFAFPATSSAFHSVKWCICCATPLTVQSKNPVMAHVFSPFFRPSHPRLSHHSYCPALHPVCPSIHPSAPPSISRSDSLLSCFIQSHL